MGRPVSPIGYRPGWAGLAGGRPTGLGSYFGRRNTLEEAGGRGQEAGGARSRGKEGQGWVQEGRGRRQHVPVPRALNATPESWPGPDMESAAGRRWQAGGGWQEVAGRQETGGREDRTLLLVQRTDWAFLSPNLLPLDHHEFETTEFQEPNRLLFSVCSEERPDFDEHKQN